MPTRLLACLLLMTPLLAFSANGEAEQQGVFIGQELITGKKLRLNRQVASWEVQRAQRDLEAVRLRVLTDVRIGHYDVLIAQQRRDLATQLVRISNQGLEAANALFISEEVSEATLDSIQRAMVEVIKNRRGTAYYALSGFSTSYNIPIAGKTGTAESGSGESHAWFAGYTYANREYQPDIAVVVIAENAGEGSEIAAPIFKAMVHLYYYGEPRSALPWEERPGVLATPESEEDVEGIDQP